MNNAAAKTNQTWASLGSVDCSPEGIRKANAAARAARGQKTTPANAAHQPGRCRQCGAYSGKYILCYDCKMEGEN